MPSRPSAPTAASLIPRQSRLRGRKPGGLGGQEDGRLHPLHGPNPVESRKVPGKLPRGGANSLGDAPG